MAFDLKNLFAKPQGWAPTVDQKGAFFSRGPEGGIAGITAGGQDAIGQGLMGAANQMPGSMGAFSQAGQQQPEVDPYDEKRKQMIAHLMAMQSKRQG